MRLIDADALFDSMNSLDYESTVKAYEAIVNAPTIDAIPVVRCKDCFIYGECQLADFIGDDGYCSCGKRRDND